MRWSSLRGMILIGVAGLALFWGGTMRASAQPTLIDTVQVGEGPLGIDLNPVTNRIYVTDFGEKLPGANDTVSIIDGVADTVVATLPVGDGPIDVAVNRNTSIVYVANLWTQDLTVVDGNTKAVVTTVPLPAGPRGVAVNPDTNLVYVSTGFSITVVDGSTNSVDSTIPVPGNGKAKGLEGVEVDADTNRIYTLELTNPSVMHVIDGDTNSVIASVPLPCYAGPPSPLPSPDICPADSNLALNAITNRMYTAGGSSFVSVFDTQSNSFVDSVFMFGQAFDVAVNPDVNRVYIANPSIGSGDLNVIDGATNTLMWTVATPSPTFGVAVNTTTGRIFLAGQQTNEVFVFEEGPPPDSDGDGIPDADDDCPNEPEDFDGFEDQDGCPDPPVSFRIRVDRRTTFGIIDGRWEGSPDNPDLRVVNKTKLWLGVEEGPTIPGDIPVEPQGPLASLGIIPPRSSVPYSVLWPRAHDVVNFDATAWAVGPTALNVLFIVLDAAPLVVPLPDGTLVASLIDGLADITEFTEAFLCIIEAGEGQQNILGFLSAGKCALDALIELKDNPQSLETLAALLTEKLGVAITKEILKDAIKVLNVFDLGLTFWHLGKATLYHGLIRVSFFADVR